MKSLLNCIYSYRYYGCDGFWRNSFCGANGAASAGKTGQAVLRGSDDARCRAYAHFLKVILPELFPALLAGFGLAFARGIGEYGSVVFIAGNIPYKTQIAPLLIMTKLEQYKYADATAIALVLPLVSFMLIFLINSLQIYMQRFSKT